mmetsp:Transcript_16885/g.40873  ORF Transcript_16885/g.40873 Transcript_16885/m.40873 type:complete len:1043 (-) Transcript_16885:42-3170(-)
MPLARRLSNTSATSRAAAAAASSSSSSSTTMKSSSSSSSSVSRSRQQRPGGPSAAAGVGSSTTTATPSLRGSTNVRPSMMTRRQSSATKLVQEPETRSMLKRRSSASSSSRSQNNNNNSSSSSNNKENSTTATTTSSTNKRSMNSHGKKDDTRDGGGDLTPGRMTRSAKKLKRMMMSTMSAASGSGSAGTTTSSSNDRDGLMLFSPPNQKANARREKEESIRNQKEWASRVESNRKKGQLLEFSSSLDCLTSLPPDEEPMDEDDHLEPTDSSVVETKPDPSPKNSDEEPQKDDCMINASNEDNDDGDTKPEATSTSDSESSKNGDVETNKVIAELHHEVKELNRRISGIHPPQPQLVHQHVPDPADKRKIEEQDAEIQKLVRMKSSLEERNQQLSLDLKQTEEKISLEVERFAGEKTVLQAQVANLESSYNKMKDQFETNRQKTADLEHNLLPQSNEQLQSALRGIDQYKTELDEKLSTIKKYESEIDDLKARNEGLLREKEEELSTIRSVVEEARNTNMSVQDESNQKDQTIGELKKIITSLKAALEKEQEEAQELKMNFQSTLEQLQSVDETRRQLEKELSNAHDQIQKDAEFKEEVIGKNKASSATLRSVEEDRQNLTLRLQQLEKELGNTREERDRAVSRLGTSDKREDELFEKLRESDRVRRELHARVMYLTGNIRVFVRVRPPIKGEEENISEDDKPYRFGGSGGSVGQLKSDHGADDPTKNLLEVIEPKKDRGGLSQRRKKWSFGFDQIYDPSCDQRSVWEGCEPLIQSAIDGFNVTIFAYGQTGSGKTYTMLGDSTTSDSEGIISRAIRKLFNSKAHIEELSRGNKQVSLSVELLEIYNENVRDLLTTGKEQTNLKVVANKAVGSTHVSVSSEKDVFRILDKAQQRRCVKATGSNETSSRSHMLFTVVFSVKSKDGSIQTGKLNVCDLAGSERLGKSGANNVGGSLLNETKHINLSLSTLSNVIEKLQSGDKNVPFRESKLTSLLQNSLDGNSKTLCIVCANPLQAHFHETLCSLRFASKISKVELKAQQNFTA